MIKTERVHTRVLPEEKKLLEQICRIEFRTEAEMIRELIREGAERRGLRPTTAHPQPISN